MAGLFPIIRPSPTASPATAAPPDATAPSDATAADDSLPAEHPLTTAPLTALIFLVLGAAVTTAWAARANTRRLASRQHP